MLTYLKIMATFVIAIVGFFLGKSRQQLKEVQTENEVLNTNLIQEKKNVEAIKNADNIDFVTASTKLRKKAAANRKRR